MNWVIGKAGLAFALAAAIGWTFMNWAIPKVIMVKAMDGLATKGRGVNAMTHREPADPYRQFVVRPSPDLLYSTCVYDLETGPLAIDIGETSGYLSVSFFDDMTNNFETVTGETLRDAKALRLLLRYKNQPAVEGITLVESPSEKGLVIIRRQISGANSLDQMLVAQSQDNCAVFDTSTRTEENS